MDGGEAIFLHHALGQADGVLEVEAVPGHERDAHVLTQSEFTHVGGRTIGEDVGASNHVTLLHQRTLVDAGVLVGTRVLGQVVDIHTCFAGLDFVVVDANHDTAGVHGVDHTATTGHDADAGVTGDIALHAGTYQRLVGTQGRHGLTLHVRAHECTVGVVVLEERNQRGSDGNDLLRRNVHQGHVFRRLDGEFVEVTNSYQLVDQTALLVEGRRSLRDHVIGFFDRREEDDLVGHLTFLDHTVRALEEAVLVGAGIGRQGVDQTDVRTFRSLNWAHAAVVGRVYVADFEAGTLTGQTARAERGNAALVGDLGERVVLVHELRQLAGTEELLDRCSHRLGVDQVLRHQAFAFGHGQTFLDRALYTHQANAELVLGHFADAADATVTQVVDVVDDALAVTDVDQGLEDVDDVFLAQHARTFDLGTTDTTVELHAADGGQVVTLGAEEQVVEQGLGGFLGRRLARTHHAVDLDQGFQLVAGGIDLQGVRNERTAVDVVGVQGLDADYLGLGDLHQHVGGQLGVALGNDLAGGRMHDGLGRGAAKDVVHRDFQFLDAGFFQLVDVAGSDTTALLHDHLAVLVLDVEHGDLATQTLGYQFQVQAFALHVEDVGGVEGVQHFFSGVVQCAQQDGGRQLAATVDTHEHAVLRVELEVQPGAAVRNDASGVQQLARAVGLATVVVEEHARGAVQLGDDDALGTVDDEGTVLGHQGDFPHVDFLFLDVLDRFVRRFFVENDQAHFHAQRDGEGHAAQHALLHVECRLAQAIADVFQGCVAGIADNRENGLEGRMQTDVTDLILACACLQEFAIGIQLDGQQIRHIHDVRQLAKVLADTFFLSV
ncbi:hypothetical protein FQZ97_626500 [compost metagenome]